MAEKMSPVEIMAKAFDEPIFEPRSTMTRKEEVVIRMRAALMALAECEPTTEMANLAALMSGGIADMHGWIAASRGYIIAAATPFDEGEDQ